MRVLLLEAGPLDNNENIHDPGGFVGLWGSDLDWQLNTADQPALGGRQILINQGKVMGGSTSINAMMYVKGNRNNFDMWNVVFTQIAFFSSVIILFAYVVFSSKRSDINTILFTIFVMVATHILFLTNGENFDPFWAVTEYKELLIPMVLLIYSLNVLTYINRVCLLK